jgi:hypothetical protein
LVWFFIIYSRWSHLWSGFFFVEVY